jgi:hypothetical protein
MNSVGRGETWGLHRPTWASDVGDTMEYHLPPGSHSQVWHISFPHGLPSC